MEQALILDFLKELAVGFKSSRSYPPGHPVMEKVVNSTMAQFAKLAIEVPEFSMYFMEKTIIFQDLRIDVTKNLAVLTLLEALKKNEINSLTFSPGVTPDDLRNLYEVMSSSKLKIKEYGDAATMLRSKGTERLKINAVKFGIQTGATIQVAKETKAEEGPLAQAELIVALRNLKELIEKGIAGFELKDRFERLVESMEKAPDDFQRSYNEAVVTILANLPSEHRIELLKDVELKPFILKLLSKLDEETLLKLIVSRSGTEKDVVKIITSVGEEKFSQILPALKEQVPNIYEYLAQLGLLLSEKITSVFTKDDLRISIRPYYSMLDSQNLHIREEGIKSLSMLAGRFVTQAKEEITAEIILRIATALEQEPVMEVVLRSIDHLSSLYKICQAHNQDKLCKSILDPFSRILGRPGLPLAFKKAAIKFLSETNNPIILPTLFSFLWETGIYPDVRSAIIKFGKDAVAEALLTLKDAEDHSLRMKLVDILKNMGKDAVDALISSLDAPEWFLRRNIIAILGDIGQKEVVPQISYLLEDPDDRVRLELVRTFMKLEYEDGLLKSLNDVSMEVKTEALKGLRKTITPEVVRNQLALLKEKDDALHLELLKIIGDKKISEANQPIVEFLGILQNRDDSVGQSLKEMAIMTLVKLGAPDLKNTLEALSHSKDKALANLAASALKRISR